MHLQETGIRNSQDSNPETSTQDMSNPRGGLPAMFHANPQKMGFEKQKSINYIKSD